MDSTFEVSDSTDWLKTSLPLLAPVESALRCQVCKDFYDTPMITSCSHTFCSLCIRKCLSSDGRCPTCREQDQASKLRRNWSIQEVVDAFQAARAQTLELARQSRENETRSGSKQSKKRKWQDPEESSTGTRKSPRQTRSRSHRTPAVASSQEALVLDSDDDEFVVEAVEENIQEPLPDGLVPCPLCSTRMKEQAVWSHLEKCDGKPPAKPSSTRSSYSQQPSSSRPPQIPTNTTRLPQLNYSLLKDGPLRKKLDELGIPSWGARELLIRRHIEWTNLYNSNADSSRPRTNRELLKDLDTWERSQGGKASAREPATKKKEFDGKAWVQGNKDQFEDLIRQARMKRSAQSAGEGKSEENQEEKAPPSINPDESNQLVRNDDETDVKALIANAAGDHPSDSLAQRSSIQVAASVSPKDTQPDLSQLTGSIPAQQSGLQTPDTPEKASRTLSRQSSLPEHLASTEVRRMPMFSLPSQPINDLDGIDSSN